MLATIGDEMHWDSTGGIVQTQGSEGCILHGSGRYVRPPDGLGLRQSPNAWFRHENGRFSNGLMAVNIALSDVAPGDGGFCVVPGSACHPLPGASVHLHVTRKSVRWNRQKYPRISGWRCCRPQSGAGSAAGGAPSGPRPRHGAAGAYEGRLRVRLHRVPRESRPLANDCSRCAEGWHDP